MFYVFILAIIIGAVLRMIKKGVDVPWKLPEHIELAVDKLLESNEEIRAIGEFSANDTDSCVSAEGAVWGIPFLGTTSYWYIAITNQRIMLVKLGGEFNEPDFDKVYKLSLSDVQPATKGISVKTENPHLPKRFYFFFGPKMITGLNKKEFIRALASTSK